VDEKAKELELLRKLEEIRKQLEDAALKIQDLLRQTQAK